MPIVAQNAPGSAPYGSSGCGDCHDTLLIDFAKTVHGTLALDEEPGSEICETCHGNGGTHVDNYDPSFIFGKDEIAELDDRERSQICLSCHKAMASSWEGSSPHRDGDVSCWDCHSDTLHGEASKVAKDVVPASITAVPDRGEFCFQCHWEVEQEFSGTVRHPLNEGGVTCASCHGPHGEAGTVETAITDDEVCAGCHMEQTGPFVFEHEAVSEGCTSCHSPHGSQNAKLLAQPGSGLCLQCHIDAGFPLLGGADHSFNLGSGATCWQCHLEVHGSNASEILAPGY